MKPEQNAKEYILIAFTITGNLNKCKVEINYKVAMSVTATDDDGKSITHPLNMPFWSKVAVKNGSFAEYTLFSFTLGRVVELGVIVREFDRLD